MTKPILLIATASSSRLDRYLVERIPALSRAQVQRLIEDGQIIVDGIPRKASYRIQKGESISVRIPPPETIMLEAEKIPFDIIFENRDLLVINKPAGMVVHPAAGHSSHTLVNAILAHLQTHRTSSTYQAKREGGVRPGIVHRLDRDTSGIIVIAKNDQAMRNLQSQFKNRSVSKAYLALVEGRVKPPRGKIDAPIGRDPRHRMKMKVIPFSSSYSSMRVRRSGLKSREAITMYNSLASLNGYTLVQAEPQTGRTHQIRVHFAFLGFPIVGDEIYGNKRNTLDLQRQFLHAWKIAFDLPRNGKRVEFTAPVPDDLRMVLEKFGIDLTLV